MGDYKSGEEWIKTLNLTLLLFYEINQMFLTFHYLYQFKKKPYRIWIFCLSSIVILSEVELFIVCIQNYTVLYFKIKFVYKTNSIFSAR